MDNIIIKSNIATILNISFDIGTILEIAALNIYLNIEY